MTETEVIQQYKRLVFSQLKRFHYTNREDRDDLKQCGYMGLIRAHRKWDSNKNTKFITYATTCIFRAMLRETLSKKKLFSNKQITENVLAKNTKYPEFLYDLSPLHHDIAIMLYSRHTISDIASKYNKDNDWVKKQIIQIRRVVIKND